MIFFSKNNGYLTVISLLCLCCLLYCYCNSFAKLHRQLSAAKNRYSKLLKQSSLIVLKEHDMKLCGVKCEKALLRINHLNSLQPMSADKLSAYFSEISANNVVQLRAVRVFKIRKQYGFVLVPVRLHAVGAFNNLYAFVVALLNSRAVIPYSFELSLSTNTGQSKYLNLYYNFIILEHVQ